MLTYYVIYTTREAVYSWDDCQSPSHYERTVHKDRVRAASRADALAAVKRTVEPGSGFRLVGVFTRPSR